MIRVTVTTEFFITLKRDKFVDVLKNVSFSTSKVTESRPNVYINSSNNHKTKIKQKARRKNKQNKVKRKTNEPKTNKQTNKQKK